MAKSKEIVKINKKHGGKEFRNFFRLIGQVKPVRKKDQATDSWGDVPFFETTTTKTGKPRRIVQFNVETALSNELKVELAGMEQNVVYPYSSTARKATQVAWADRHDKTKYPDDTYHLIDPEWDKAEKIGQTVNAGDWVEIKGHYEFDTIVNEDGKESKFKKRIIDSCEVIQDGHEVKQAGETFKYVCDFNSPEFKEVNYFSMQLGIKSTYQDENTKDTRVNGVFLAYGKDRSEPKDVELTVYHVEPEEGKRSLADAFGTLQRLDFIEVTGQDNNRATFTYVDVVEELEDDDPFADVDSSAKVTRKERVVSGDKKGLEITGYVTGSKINGFLTEEEITKPVQDESPFSVDISDDPFAEIDDDPFKD
jgi:hypothetical protein